MIQPAAGLPLPRPPDRGRRLLDGLSASDRHEVLAGTASRTYGVALP